MGNKMKRILRALDEKDLSSLTSLIAHQWLDPNKLIPEKGVTFFHLIIGHHSENFAYKVAKLFLRSGGDPNIPSQDGVTPIHVAAAWGRTRILHLLLVNGGDPWIQDDERKNAFNYAFEEQEWDAVEMLHHFQQMHTSALQKRDIHRNSKFELNFKRIVLTRDDEILEYALVNEKNEKYIKGRESNGTENEKMTSPILSKIKYFESHPCKIDGKCEEKSNKALLEEFYETSCKFMVNIENNSGMEHKKEELPEKNEEAAQNHFVSSVHIDTSPLKTAELLLNCSNTSNSPKKSLSNPMEKCLHDIRSQLFMELKEAVLRRSELMLNEEKPKKADKSGEKSSDVKKVSPKSSMVYISKDEHAENSNGDDPFLTKEVSYLHGVNLSSNAFNTEANDFSPKELKEIELTEDERESDSERGNLAMTSTYLTCEEGSYSNENMLEENIFNNSSAFCENARNISQVQKSNDSFQSVVTDDFKWSDPLDFPLANSLQSSASVVREIAEESEDWDKSSAVSDICSIESGISCTSDVLRMELTNFGFIPGPITKTTKKLYLRKLGRLKRRNEKSEPPIIQSSNYPPTRVYSSEVEKTLKNEINLERILSYVKLEEEMMRTFDENPNGVKWRQGGSKTSFNYLLLDPRVCLNLPKRAVSMGDTDIWRCFLSSVFYVGKGKRARPYAHLVEAASWWEKRPRGGNSNAKIDHIIQIWSENLGVVCVHVFQNIIPVEAFTREAAMIDAIGLKNLKNVKGSEYYGCVAKWMTKDKLKLGVYLLYKAMLIFLNEGERQIRPFDVS